MEKFTHCEENLIATVVASTSNHAQITLQSSKQNTCKNCAKHGGCQSLSVYHWFFDKNRVDLPQRKNPPYVIGEALIVAFPDSLLRRALGVLIGIPLSGFLLGISTAPLIGELASFALSVCLATVGFFGIRKRLQKHLACKIQINTR